MKKMYSLLMLLLSMSAAVVAQVDVVALKKNMQDEAAAGVKRMVEEAQKAADDFKLRDVLSETLVKTYPKSDHEAFHSVEEKKIIERINSKASRLSDEMASLVEKAFVDAMKEQQRFEDLCKQDIAAFKQQFSESVEKMAQGKKATPITYTASEGVVKGAPAEKKSSKDGMMPAASKKDMSDLSKMADEMPPFKSLPAPKKNAGSADLGMPSDSGSSNMGMSVDGGGANMGTPVNAPMPVFPTKPDVKKAASFAVKKSAGSASSTSKAQADLLKQIRG